MSTWTWAAPQSHPSLRSSWYLNSSMKLALLTLGRRNLFLLWPRIEPSWGLFQSLPWIALFVNTSISQREITPVVSVIKSYHCILLSILCHSAGLFNYGWLPGLSLPPPPSSIPTSSLPPHLWTMELEKRNWICALCCCFSGLESYCSGFFFNASWPSSEKAIVFILSFVDHVPSRLFSVVVLFFHL